MTRKAVKTAGLTLYQACGLALFTDFVVLFLLLFAQTMKNVFTHTHEMETLIFNSSVKNVLR